MFEKRINWASRELMKVQYKNKINETNISSLTKRSIKKILKEETKTDREGFLLFLISKWIDLQEVKNVDFIKKLKRLIRKTKITLTENDIHDLTLLEERSFSEYRHIKILNVSTELEVKENVGVKYVKAQLYEHTKRLTLILEGDLLISNRRIFFENTDKEDVNFRWEEISSYSFRNYGFEFKVNDNTYVIRIHDQETLNNTLRNMISKKIKYIQKKEV